MRQAILGVAVVSLILSCLYIIGSFAYPIGTLLRPGTRVYLLFVGGLLITGSLGTAVTARSEKAPRQVEWPRGAPLLRVGILAIALLAYIVLLPYAGYLVAGAVLVPVTLHMMGGLRWQTKVGLTLAIVAASYYVFGILLGTSLPKGIWFR